MTKSDFIEDVPDEVLKWLQDFYLFIAHGDDNHRAWLEEAFIAFMNGKERPPAR